MRTLNSLVVLFVAAALCTSAGAAPTAEALIRPGAGIGKVRIGMTYSQVRRVLGKPWVVNERKRLGFGNDYVEYDWDYTRWTVGFVGRRGRTFRAVAIATTVRSERTKHGVGVGSTVEQVVRRLRTRCEYPYQFYDGCGIRSPNGAATVFRFHRVCSVRTFPSQNCPSHRETARVFEVVVRASGFRQP